MPPRPPTPRPPPGPAPASRSARAPPSTWPAPSPWPHGDALVRSRSDRLAAITAAERTGDLALTARIIGAYDVPALWSRADDPAQSRAVVEAAERTLTVLGPDAPADLTARLLATVAVESRGADLTPPEQDRARDAARQAERLARDLGDPGLLAFTLNGVFLQSFTRPGLAAARDRTGAEILHLATAHDLPAFAVLGLLRAPPVRLRPR